MTAVANGTSAAEEGLRKHLAGSKGEAEGLDLEAGVSIYWLAKAFGLEISTVRQKLATCPTLRRKTSGYVYSIPVAAQYLVKPRVSVAQYLATMKPSDLPKALTATYWDSALKRQKWEEIALHLWPTESVVEVFADVFKRIKFTLQLAPDTVEREAGLSDEQRASLQKVLDQLQDGIFKDMVAMSRERSTSSYHAQLETLLAEGGAPEDDEEDSNLDVL